MKITILCTNQKHPVYEYLEKWVEHNKNSHQIVLLNSVKEVNLGGDILFLISCSEIIKKEVRDKFRFNLVIHASDLPEGRGWSPHIWDILAGKDVLTLSLLNAEDGVDAGDIWRKLRITLTGNELFNEINHKLFEAELELMTWACENIDLSKPEKQLHERGSYHRKRTPVDSEIDIQASLFSQFNLLRVCDPDRFPAFFVLNGQKYNIRLEKSDD